MGKVRITYDGKVVLTVGQAAERYGLEVTAMRKAVQRLAVAPVGELDGRTPLWLASELDAAMKARPGHGGRPPKTKPA